MAGDEIALLPVDPDASAAALRAALRGAAGRATSRWSSPTRWAGRGGSGQTDAAIGVVRAGVLHRYARVGDRHGNELVVTEVAVADEIAAAADLVKGKLGGVPVAVVRGLPVGATTGRTARDLVRPVEEDLFRLGTDEAVAQGRARGGAAAAFGAAFPATPVARTRCAGPWRRR